MTNAGDVNIAAVLSLGLAFWMRPNEWFFLDVECLANPYLILKRHHNQHCARGAGSPRLWPEPVASANFANLSNNGQCRR